MKTEDLISKHGGALQTSPGTTVDTIRLSLEIDPQHYAWIELDEDGVNLLIRRLEAWKSLRALS